MTSTEPRPELLDEVVAALEAVLRDADALAPLDVPVTAAARRSMREQIALLQETLRRTVEEGWAPDLVEVAARGARFEGPRLLDLGELEAVRDDLVTRVDGVRTAVRRLADDRAAAAALLERMYAEPDAHRGARVSTDDLGVAGCCRWEVLPVLGIVGRLAGWWRVRVSSGCP